MRRRSRRSQRRPGIAEKRRPLLLIDSNPERAQWSIQEGIPTLVADATQDETLRRSHVELAKGLVAAISSDAENVYVTLSARVLNPDLIIWPGPPTSRLKKNSGAPVRQRSSHRIRLSVTGWLSRCFVHTY